MPFFCFHISQGSVATLLKRGGIFKHEFVANLPPSQLLKKIMKIGQYLVKLWPRVWCLVFFDSRCSGCKMMVVVVVLVAFCNISGFRNAFCFHYVLLASISFLSVTMLLLFTY